MLLWPCWKCRETSGDEILLPLRLKETRAETPSMIRAGLPQSQSPLKDLKYPLCIWLFPWTVSRSSAVSGNEWGCQRPHPGTALNTECQAGGKVPNFEQRCWMQSLVSVGLSHATYWVTPTGAGCAQRIYEIQASEQFELWWMTLGSEFNNLVKNKKRKEKKKKKEGVMSVTAFLQKIDLIAMNGLVAALTPLQAFWCSGFPLNNLQSPLYGCSCCRIYLSSLICVFFFFTFLSWGFLFEMFLFAFLSSFCLFLLSKCQTTQFRFREQNERFSFLPGT